MVYVAGALEGVVGARPISSLLEPSGDGLVVLEGIVEVCPDSCLYQPVVDSLLGVVPLGPISAQLSVSFFEVLLVKGRLPQVVDVGFYSDILKVSQLCIDQSVKGKSPVEPVEVALMWCSQSMAGQSLERFAVYDSVSSKNPVDSRVALGINCIPVTELSRMPNLTIRTA